MYSYLSRVTEKYRQRFFQALAEGRKEVMLNAEFVAHEDIMSMMHAGLKITYIPMVGFYKIEI